jgi:penicillin-binding protein 2
VTLEGTSARVFAGAGYLSGGKTGTAQAVTIGQKDKYNSAKMEEFQRDHAVYMAFAPAANPQIALAVIVENAGWGAGVAAPIARRVFDYALLGQYPSEEDMVAVQKGLAAAPTGTPRLAAEMVGALVPGAAGSTSAGALAPALAHAAALAAAHAASAPKTASDKPVKMAAAAKKAAKKTSRESGADTLVVPATPAAAVLMNPD